MKQAVLRIFVTIVTALGLIASSNFSVMALGSSQTPQSGPLGLEATIPSSPPSSPPSVTIPSNGQAFNAIPITIAGICSGGLLVKVFSNSVFIGSTVCSSGTYSLKADLFNGANAISAQQFDALGQASPSSGTVSVSYSSGQYSQPGSQVTVTSSYGELGANPGQQLTWPIIIGGGTPPYAISTDWGDGTSAALQSSAFSGTINLHHTYAVSGIYGITVTVTDNKGSTAFLQVVGVANGQIAPSNNTGSSGTTQTRPSGNATTSIPWWVFMVIVVALGPTFWLGNRHGKAVLMRKYQ